LCLYGIAIAGISSRSQAGENYNLSIYYKRFSKKEREDAIEQSNPTEESGRIGKGWE
jgi:hypothetical protein